MTKVSCSGCGGFSYRKRPPRAEAAQPRRDDLYSVSRDALVASQDQPLIQVQIVDRLGLIATKHLLNDHHLTMGDSCFAKLRGRRCVRLELPVIPILVRLKRHKTLRKAATFPIGAKPVPQHAL